MTWTVYILQCADNTLYTGISQNVKQRIARHEKGIGARYTKNRGPFTLVYTEKKETKGEALKREKEIKSLTRTQKLCLIAQAENHLT